MPALVSIPTILDVDIIRGARATEGAPFDLVFEIPHGATRTEDFTSLAAQLTSPLPEGLVDFFHVNTDAGAPELAVATARKFVELEPARTVAILRCRIPRTLIDCNRRVDASPEDFKAGKVSPGIMPWITDPADRVLLRAAYDGYIKAVKVATLLLASDGAMVLLHSYAPREVDVEVDLEIVKSLRAAYRPETVEKWPLRPDLDVIGKGLDGTSYAPAGVVAALREQLAGRLTIADSATYPLHSSTMAWDHVMAHPGRTLCLEVRRDLLADPFEPFAQMKISDAKVERIAIPLATALRRWW